MKEMHLGFQSAPLQQMPGEHLHHVAGHERPMSSLPNIYDARNDISHIDLRQSIMMH
jgi:hypothetical protein